MLCAVALGSTVLLAGCEGPVDKAGFDTSQINLNASNGAAWNGLSWNGAAWNGIGWNGAAWNGIGWNGAAWNGIGWNGAAWNGAAWNGAAWNGAAWNGAAWNGVQGQDSPTFTTLHNWANHTDTDGDGVPAAAYINKCGPGNPQTYSATYLNSSADLNNRLSALSYWVSCACPASVRLTFSDTHGRGSVVLDGGLGLAPTWCGTASSCAAAGCKDAVVPESEQQLVSACLMTRVNTRGIHFPLSLTGPGIGSTANELISHRQLLPASAFFGNLWKSPHYSQDATTGEGTFPGNEGTAGGQWKNSEKFVCNFNTSTGINTNGLILLGRECEANGCDHVTYLGGCTSNRKRKVTDSSSASYQQPAAPMVNDSAVAGGMYTSTLTYTAAYRGLTYSPIYVAEPAVMNFESGLAGPPLTGPAWIEWSVGTFSPTACPATYKGLPDCWVGSSSSAGKLAGLDSSQSLQGVLTGNRPDFVLNGDPMQPMALGIRYSRALDIGQLNVMVNNNVPKTPGWTAVQGAGSNYSRVLFPATGSFNTYSTAYIYPVYFQDTIAVSAPRADGNGSMVSYDTLRFWISGATASKADAPHLDMAYFFPGAPPASADCTSAKGGCFLYAGPYQSYQLEQGQEVHYTTPFLPPGTYLFQLGNMSGAIDLYVKWSDPVYPAAPTPAASTVYDCVDTRPYLNRSRTCYVTVGGRGGQIDVLMRGSYEITSTATLQGSN